MGTSFSHLTEEETEAQEVEKVAQSHEGRKWGRQDSNPTRLASEPRPLVPAPRRVGLWTLRLRDLAAGVLSPPDASTRGDGESARPVVDPALTPRAHRAEEGRLRDPALAQGFCSSIKGSWICRRSHIWLVKFIQSKVVPELL